MQSRCRRVAALGMVVMAALLAASCGAGTPKKQEAPMTVEEFEKNTVQSKKTEEPEDPCTAKRGEAIECKSNEDCPCKGYTCGVDPERSHVLKYCLPT